MQYCEHQTDFASISLVHFVDLYNPYRVLWYFDRSPAKFIYTQYSELEVVIFSLLIIFVIEHFK